MRLVGKRIFLRFWKKSDIPRIVEMCQDKAISRFTTVPFPYTKKHARQFIARSAKTRRQKQEFNFAIIWKQSNFPIGSISLLRFDWKSKHAEIGYWLAKEFRGREIVPEATELLMDFGFNKLKLHRIEGQCAVKNNPSRRVFEKLCFEFECTRKERGFLGEKFTDVFSFAILEREFKKRKKRKGKLD